MSRRTFWQWLVGREPAPPAVPPPAAEPQHLGSADEAFLARLVADLADGKRRGEIADAGVLRALDGLWTSGHERLAIEWLEKLLSVPEIPAAATAPLRAVLVERYEQRAVRWPTRRRSARRPARLDARDRGRSAGRHDSRPRRHTAMFAPR